MNAQIIIIILVVLLVITAIDLAIQCFRLTKVTEKLTDEALKANQKASNDSKKLIIIENEVNTKELSDMSHLDLFNSYRRIKKVIANEEALTTTHK